MKQTRIKIAVIWEYVITPDAPQRLAAAFTMLLGPTPRSEVPPECDLDTNP